MACAAMLVGLFSSILPAQSRDVSAAADSLARAFFTENRVPALSVAVAFEGRIVFQTALGLADVENNVPATTETVFRIASVTKPLTAAGVLRLADDGRLDLDAPIQTYCPAYPEKRWTVTSRDLLSHVGGLRDYTRIEQGVWKVQTRGGFQVGSNTIHFADIDEAVEVFASDSLAFEPGTGFRYTNLGFVLLGCAIEGASGETYADFMAAEVWEPVNMVRTRPNDAWTVIPGRARNYQMRTEQTAGWWWFTPAQKSRMEIGRLYNARFEDTSHKLPAGGLVSTAGDLVRFGTALLEGRLLSDELLDAMLTERTVPGDTAGVEAGTGWGLGLSVDERNGHRIAGLRGGQAGVSAVLTMLPERNLVIAAIANRDLVPVTDLVRDLAAVWGSDLSVAASEQ